MKKVKTNPKTLKGLEPKDLAKIYGGGKDGPIKREILKRPKRGVYDN